MSITNFCLIGEEKAKKINTRVDAKEWCLGGPCHRHDVSIYTYYSGNGGAKFSKHLGSTRNWKELVVKWGQPRLRRP